MRLIVLNMKQRVLIIPPPWDLLYFIIFLVVVACSILQHVQVNLQIFFALHYSIKHSIVYLILILD